MRDSVPPIVYTSAHLKQGTGNALSPGAPTQVAMQILELSAHIPRCRGDKDMSFCQTCGTSLPVGSSACHALPARRRAGCRCPRLHAGCPSAPLPPCTLRSQWLRPALPPNVAGALAYLVGAITGILFLVIDPFKADRFVRFHAFQSIFFNLAWIAFWIVWTILRHHAGARFLTVCSSSSSCRSTLLIMVGGFCLWAYLMYTAYQGKMYSVAGDRGPGGQPGRHCTSQPASGCSPAAAWRWGKSLLPCCVPPG